MENFENTPLHTSKKQEAAETSEKQDPAKLIEKVRTYIRSFAPQVLKPFYEHPEISQKRKDEVELTWRAELRIQFNRLYNRVDAMPVNGEDPDRLAKEIIAYHEELYFFFAALKAELRAADERREKKSAGAAAEKLLDDL